ncbi:uncharacterized protein PFL1_04539 [Pseudozyma flocculosa PF-1]|uniref:Carboxypeptidase n=1 Tax=Pseudozyma flocculosa PF-1 TaxID=1277687 RepID=A0A061H5Q7_9BASI|nr:uncharacterized protein PFL1_04539 [Pseudozyma flocculosa PF-1]EPQ27794.1 hypothetical protein PFL1_04539 [Pseudozyma flocculosa PF-1]
MRNVALSALAAIVALATSAAATPAATDYLDMPIGRRSPQLPTRAPPNANDRRLGFNSQIEAAASYLDAYPGPASSSSSASSPMANAAAGAGAPLRVHLPLDPADANAFAASSVEDIIARNRGQHVVLSHRDFPQLSVRIKQLGSRPKATSPANNFASRLDKSDPEAFCDPTVTSWSGYIDTLDGKSLFFYFFESRNDPKRDPVVLWTNGGPGCSSSLGLFQEHGPCRIPERGGVVSDGPPINGTQWHPQSWNSRANMIYIDQPVGVGFSYSRYGVHSFNTEDAAKDIYRFLRIFFSAFDRFRDNDFHLSGESYGGRYIPVFASEVEDRNAHIRHAARKAGKKPRRDELINLKSIIVGNGLTDVSKQMSGYYDMSCTRRGGVAPILPIEQCKRMSSWVPRCERWLHDHCVATYSADLCRTARDTCSAELEDPYMMTGMNPYDITDDCKAGISPNLCYAVMEDIRAYLDRADVRELLGAAPVEEIGRFQTCNDQVAMGFINDNDAAQDNGLNVALLLERGIKALIYVGDLDFICNWVGNKKNGRSTAKTQERHSPTAGSYGQQ